MRQGSLSFFFFEHRRGGAAEEDDLATCFARQVVARKLHRVCCRWHAAEEHTQACTHSVYLNDNTTNTMIVEVFLNAWR